MLHRPLRISLRSLSQHLVSPPSRSLRSLPSLRPPPLLASPGSAHSPLRFSLPSLPQLLLDPPLLPIPPSIGAHITLHSAPPPICPPHFILLHQPCMSYPAPSCPPDDDTLSHSMPLLRVVIMGGGSEGGQVALVLQKQSHSNGYSLLPTLLQPIRSYSHVPTAKVTYRQLQ